MFVDRPIYLTVDGQACEAEDPRASVLLADAGTALSPTDVERLGIKGGPAGLILPSLGARPQDDSLTPRRCQARTRKGEQCERDADEGSDYCSIPSHQKQGD